MNEGAILNELGRLTSSSERGRFVATHPEVLSPDFVVRLSDQVAQAVREDAKTADLLAEGALFVAESLEDAVSRGHALRAKANALLAAGDYRAALSRYQEASRLFDAAGAAVEVGRTLSTEIQALILLGEYDAAVEASGRARLVFEAAGDERRLARLEINVGNIFHRQDRFREALERYRRAYQELLPMGDAEGVAAALSNIVLCLTMLNDFRGALETYEEAREACERGGFPLLAARADYNIAYLHYLKGEYSRSLEMLVAAREEFERIEDPYHAALCDLDQSEIYLELDLIPEAADLAKRAQSQFRELGTGYELAKAVTNEAIALSHQGQFIRALELFETARAMFDREKNESWPFILDLYRAFVLFDEGRWFEARRLCSEASEYFQSSALTGKAVLARMLLAHSSLLVGDVAAARREVNLVLEKLMTLNAPLLTYQANFLMGQIEEAASNFGSAYESYQTARHELEALRSSLRGEELKISFTKNRLAVYESLVELSVPEDDDGEKAKECFQYIELAKSRGLVELILSPGRKGSLPEPGESHLAKRIHTLREELNWYYRRLEKEEMEADSRSLTRIGELQEQTLARESELLSVLRKLPASDRGYGGLKSASPLDLSVVQKTLGPDATLLEYYSARDRIYVCLLTRDSIEIVPLTVAPRVRDAVQRLEFQLSKFKLSRDYVETFYETLYSSAVDHLHELYLDLVDPIRHLLETRHLVVVPHGFLHYLPFHALYDGERYLIDDFTVSYAPSASVFAHCQRKPSSGVERSLILGVPRDDAPHILEEAHAVAATVPSPRLLLGDDASLDALRDLAPSSGLVHIATHGYFRQDNPMFSAIRLGDSYLSLYDLYRLDLPVDLVTLSACASGLSVVMGGDELLGLVRGLLYAGARSLLLTLWDVQDRTTAEFMRSFYAHRETEPRDAEALRRAALEIRERHPHPFFWAPYLLVGKAFGKKGA